MTCLAFFVNYIIPCVLLQFYVYSALVYNAENIKKQKTLNEKVCPYYELVVYVACPDPCADEWKTKCQ